MLARNENPYGPAPSAIAAATDAATKGCYYSDRGVRHLQEMIAERHSLSPEQVVIGEGSTEILSAIAISWGREGAILCPGLFWDTTVQYGERLGAQAIRVPLAADMNVDLPAMQAAFGDGISLVQVCNPNNPTGTVATRETLKRWVDYLSSPANGNAAERSFLSEWFRLLTMQDPQTDLSSNVDALAEVQSVAAGNGARLKLRLHPGERKRPFGATEIH